MTYLITVLVCLVAWLGGFASARACSPQPPAAPTALPRAGASDVSSYTFIVLLSPTEPFGLDVKVNGLAAAVDSWSALGPGFDAQLGPTRYWALHLDGRVGLDTQAAYQVSLPSAGADGGVAELTHFTTASGYDKTSGTAAHVRSLRLSRVRYPVEAIGGGGCVFSEYIGFMSVDYDTAVVPKTDPASVVQMFQLVPKNGGTPQTLIYTGANRYQGYAPSAGADYYPPAFWTWQPELDPSREYCLSISASGDGDLARPTNISSPVCAYVTELAAKGASVGSTNCRAVGEACSAVGDTPRSYAPAALIAALLGLATRRRRRTG